MALLFIDSADHYGSGDILLKYDANSGTITTGSGIVGRFSQGIDVAASGRYFQKNVTAYATYIMGMAFKFDVFPNSDTQIVALYDAGTLQTDLRMTSGGLLRITRNGTSLGLGTTALSLNVWYYIEFKVTINDTTGVAVARINGNTELNLTSQDTKNTVNATADQIRFGPGVGSLSAPNWIYDDIYICDDTGGSPTNDLLGDIRVEAIMPGGNGNSSQLLGSDGNSVDNYLLVDDAADPNDDTDYVESSTVGDKDTYAFGNLTTTGGTVYAVQLLPYARKTDAGTRKIATVARLSATEADSADKTLSTTYQYHRDLRETKPGGGTWTITNVNDAEFGVKITA